jgi:photosystem II stability/assembly factor-like uncharacterized protein
MKCIPLALISLLCLAGCEQAASVSPADMSLQTAEISKLAGSPAVAETTAPANPLQPTDTSLSCTTLTSPEVRQSEQWKIINQFQVFGDFTLLGFLNPMHGIGVGLESMIYYSNDNAHTWLYAQNQSNCLFGLEIVDENVAWTCGNVGDVRLSTDGGKTWQVAKNFRDHTLAYCHHLSFLDAATGWAATSTELGLTTDGAQTWNPVALPQGIGEMEAIFLRTVLEGYILDSSGRLYITTDGGKTWGLSTLPGYGSVNLVTQTVPNAAIRFSDTDNGMAVYQTRDCTTGWHLWVAYTSSGGRVWEVEQLSTDPQAAWPLYLSRDAQFLTLMMKYPNILAKDVTLFQYTP